MMESSSSSQHGRAERLVSESAPGDEERVPAPLVVIEYRSNPVPVILLSLAITVLALAGFAYHRHTVATMDRRAAEAVLASADLVDSERSRSAVGVANPAVLPGAGNDAEMPSPRADSAVKIAEPLALNSQPTPVPARVNVKPAETTKAVASPAVDPAPAVVDRAVAAAEPNKGSEKPKVVTAAPAGGIVAAVGIAAVGEKAVPAVEKGGDAAGARPTEPEKSEVAVAREVVLKPLPSKEETLRAIEDEANQKRVEIAERERGQLEELRASRVESRSRFRKQLKDLLAEQGSRAGKAIDTLSEQYREFVPPVVHQKASRIWANSARTIDQRIQLIRALGLSESLILDLMSDDFYQNLRARNGPRTKSEVRVRAAMLLLKHDPEEIESLAEQTPGVGPGDNGARRSIARPGIR